jgi:hypothetical protein
MTPAAPAGRPGPSMQKGRTMVRTLQDLFRRFRRPGDMVFALLFFVFSAFLFLSIPAQITWVERTGLVSQPGFWPVVAVGCMAVFSFLHLVGSAVSERIPGRAAEIWEWIRPLEFVVWFLVYVWLLPYLGYLPSSLLFACVLAFRLGYRSMKWMGISALFALAVVVVFKSLLQVKLPAGEIYRLLPAGDLRTFFMVYL